MPIQEIATEKFQGPHLGIGSSANLMNKIFEKKSCSLNIPFDEYQAIQHHLTRNIQILI